jgi:hypothetical protein
MKYAFTLLLFLPIALCFTPPLSGQILPNNGLEDQISFTQGNIAVYYVNEPSGNEILIPCGSGVNFGNEVPVDDSYSVLYRIYPVPESPNDEAPLQLSIYDLYLQSTDFHYFEFPNGFDDVLTEGESLDVRIYFEPTCPSVITNGLVIESSAENAPICLQRLDQVTESGDGAQLSVSALFPSNIGLQEWTVIPASQGLEVPAFPENADRQLRLDIQNFGNEDLIIFDIYVYGPASLNNTHPSQSIEFEEPILPGQQRFVWIDMDEETDCDGQAVQVLIKSTDNITCGPSFTNYQFKFFVYPSEDCPEEEEQPDENEERRRIALGKSAHTDGTNLRIFPTLASSVLWVERSEEAKGSTYQIIDVTGQIVQQSRIPSGELRTSLQVEALRPGHYFLRDMASETVARFVKQ